MEDKIIYEVIHEILEKLEIKANWKGMKIDNMDGILELDFNGQKVKFNAEIKKEIRNYHLPEIFLMAEYNRPLMVITEKNIFPGIKDELRKKGIAFIDLKGNVDIRTDKLLIKVEGNHTTAVKPEKHGRAFTKAGLKVIFLFLRDNNLINESYREIAKKAGIALGNINYIFEGLKEENFILKKDEKKFTLINKKELLERWITAYDEKLKPALHIGNFRFGLKDNFRNWKNLELNLEKTAWGGEAAGDILTNYLKPEILTLYTNEKKLDLMKKFRLIPEPDGELRIYGKFWDFETEFKKTVPPVLAYADLINTGDGRCIETAQKIYEQYLKNTF